MDPAEHTKERGGERRAELEDLNQKSPKVIDRFVFNYLAVDNAGQTPGVKPGGVRTTIAKHHGWYLKSDHLCQDGVE